MYGDSKDFPIADIKVNREERQRRKLVDIDVLAKQIEAVGLINPIVIREDGTLVAGERRLEAHKLLGRQKIKVRIFERLSPTNAELVELQENIARADLSWQDQTSAIVRYHALKLKQANNAWTAKATGADLGFSERAVQAYLQVGKHLVEKEVNECPTFRGALNFLTNRAERAAAAAKACGFGLAAGTGAPPVQTPANPAKAADDLLKSIADGPIEDLLAPATAKLADTPAAGDALDKALAQLEAGATAQQQLREAAAAEPAATTGPTVLCADFISWLETYDGEPFDVLHCDFPYGKGYTGPNTRKSGKAHYVPIYDDSPDIYWALLEAMLQAQDKIAYSSAHCIFWFDMLHYTNTVAAFEAAGWRLAQPHPLIWTKGYEGVAADPKRRPRHCYETALLFSRGDRKIVKLDKDHFECGTNEKLHLNQKPFPVLQHFLKMVTDEHTAVLDPTCGSGSALAVAHALGSPRVLGLELDPGNAEIARYISARGVPTDA